MIKIGTTRIVFLIGKFAIKVPRITHWHLFLHGLLSNMQETTFSHLKDEKLCPVLFSFPLGFLNIMPRTQPITRDKFKQQFPIRYHFVLWLWAEDCSHKLPVEYKQDSFGLLDGRLVAVDYGQTGGS